MNDSLTSKLSNLLSDSPPSDAALRELLVLLTGDSKPNINPLNELLRNLPVMQWNMKVHGYLIAKLLLGSTSINDTPVTNKPFSPKWSASVSGDFLTQWFRDVCSELKIEPVFHRKIWELVYVVKNLDYFSKLSPGMSGLGFGCGTEPLPSFFAAKEISVVATDLEPSDQSSKGWIATDQHLSDLQKIWKSELCSQEQFNKNVSLSYVDMNNIPYALEGRFDFCWSICAFEHLGSIQKGLDFVKNSLKTLKPGGIAIHTTEFNYSSKNETIDNWGTVLFRESDFLNLSNELRALGYEVPDTDFSVGNTPIDWFIDIPPYDWDKNHFQDNLPSLPHLKLTVDGFPSTCFGLVVRKPVDFAD